MVQLKLVYKAIGFLRLIEEYLITFPHPPPTPALDP